MPAIRNTRKRVKHFHPYQKHVIPFTYANKFCSFIEKSEFVPILYEMTEHILPQISIENFNLKYNADNIRNILKPYIFSFIISGDSKYVCYTIMEIFDFCYFYSNYKKLSRIELYEFMSNKSDKTYLFEEYIDSSQYHLEDIIPLQLIAYCKYIQDLSSVFISDIECEYSNYAIKNSLHLFKKFNSMLNFEIYFISKFYIEKEEIEKEEIEIQNILNSINNLIC